jgi:MFS superfamily sulfate permease-like transporter
VIVLLVLMFLTGPLQYLPRCVLASIVFTVAANMVDVRGLRNIFQKSCGEFLLAVATAAAVVAVGVEQGILLAIGLSLVGHVRHSYQAQSMVLVPGASGIWEPIPAHPGLQTAPGLIVYRFGADLFYANADRFADEVRQLVDKAPAPIKWLVIGAEAITDIDLSAAETVRGLVADLSHLEVHLFLARVSPYLLSDLRQRRLVEVIGEGRIFPTLREALEAARQDGFAGA